MDSQSMWDGGGGDGTATARLRYTRASGKDERSDERDLQKKLRKTAFHASALPLKTSHWFSLALAFFLAFTCSTYYDSKLPRPKAVGPLSTKFSEAAARKCLKRLTSYGPRVSGSEACERFSVDHILAQIESVKTAVSKRPTQLQNEIEVDVQRPDGCYHLDFLTSFTLCYRNVTNIVVRLSPAWRKEDPSAARHSLLFNSHFDTVPDSPGASDDGVSVCVLLEVLRAFAVSAPLKHDFVFLFNGAEENILQAAHGFITKHRWRHNIRAFINLEAAGAGGREVLFQAGPGNPWLVQMYIMNAKYPYASIMAQEIFQSGLIPSDTDFRIFRDFGKIPGLDLAFSKNGYVYHTEYDSERMIAPGAVQRAGENILYTALALANSSFLSNPGDFEHLQQRWVYFDLLGLVVIHYPHRIGNFINSLVVVLSLLNLGRKMVGNRHLDEKYTFRQVFTAFGIILLSYCAAVLVLGLCALAVTATGLIMSWYARPVLILVLYTLPGSLSGLCVHIWASRRIYRRANPWSVECLYHDCLVVTLAAGLATGTFYDLGSSYYVLCFVLCPLIREVALLPIMRWFPFVYNDERKYATVFLGVHLITFALPMLMFAMGTLQIFQLFIPIMGRSGHSVNPEFVVAGISAVSCATIIHISASLVYISAPVEKLGRWLAGCLCLSWLVIAFSSLHVPYMHSTSGIPALKRLHVQHVERTIYGYDQTVRYRDQGLWFVPMDYRGLRDFGFPEFAHSKPIREACILDDSFCGFPYYLPVQHFLFDDTRWLPTVDSPPVERPVHTQLVSRSRIGEDLLEIVFTVQGTDHMTLHVTPVSGWRLESWSLTERILGRPKTYFVFLGDTGPVRPWTVKISLRKTRPASPESPHAVTVAVSSHALHGPAQVSPAMASMYEQVRKNRAQGRSIPDWDKWQAVMHGWTSQYVAHEW